MTNNWRKSWPALLGLLIALLVALGIAIYIMQAPSGDIQDLLRFLLTSSLPSLLIGYLVFNWSNKRLRSIRLKMLFAYSLGVIIAIVNIYVTSKLMFVSWHDFLLLGLLLIFAGLISTSFGIILAKELTQTLRRLRRSANQLAGGDFSTRIHLDSVDELSDVASAFNLMADELERAFARQKQLEQARQDLTAAVSHDLRTPLTSIRAMIEALSDGLVSDPDTVQRYYVAIRAQTENLSGLINDLFELSQLESGQVELRKDPVNLNDLLSDVIESMQPQANAKSISIEGVFCPDTPIVQAEVLKIQRVLYNLLQNAIRHTPAGGSISLSTAVAAQGVRVEISDTGEGIPPADLPHIFEQFYRGDKSRSRQTGGAGLGLAIAKRIIQAHGGQIQVESNVAQGSKFSFVLPL